MFETRKASANVEDYDQLFFKDLMFDKERQIRMRDFSQRVFDGFKHKLKGLIEFISSVGNVG